MIEPQVPSGTALGRRLLQEARVQLVLLRRRTGLLLLLLHHQLGVRLEIRLQRDLKRGRRSEGCGGGVGKLLERGIWRKEGKWDVKATCKIRDDAKFIVLLPAPLPIIRYIS